MIKRIKNIKEYEIIKIIKKDKNIRFISISDSEIIIRIDWMRIKIE